MNDRQTSYTHLLYVLGKSFPVTIEDEMVGNIPTKVTMAEVIFKIFKQPLAKTPTSQPLCDTVRLLKGSAAASV
jgi:hypothetical protein